MASVTSRAVMKVIDGEHEQQQTTRMALPNFASGSLGQFRSCPQALWLWLYQPISLRQQRVQPCSEGQSACATTGCSVRKPFATTSNEDSMGALETSAE